MAGEDGGDESEENEALPADLEALRTAHTEARTVLDHQIELLNDSDDKAMRTVRITLLIIGLIVSIASVIDVSGLLPDITVFGLNVIAGLLSLGLLWLLAAAVAGIIAYSASMPDFGPGPSYIADARSEPYTEAEFIDELLAGYESWLQEAEETNEETAALLFLSQGALISGIIFLSIGIALTIWVS